MTIDVAALKNLWKQAFGDTDPFIHGFFTTGFSPMRCNTLEQDGHLAAALYWFDCLWQGRKIAYIYGVATDKAFRKQGLCRKLMDDTHEQLHEAGYAGAVLVPAADELSRMYEKMGYRGFCPMVKKTVLPALTREEVKVITPEEYSRLRQDRISENGVGQDLNALRFYETYGKFYCAGSSVFSAAKEDDMLYVQEFLGDPGQLPGIAAALDCSAAQVRLPGGDNMFAMYRSFTNDQDMPAYFGIALD